VPPSTIGKLARATESLDPSFAPSQSPGAVLGDNFFPIEAPAVAIPHCPFPSGQTPVVGEYLHLNICKLAELVVVVEKEEGRKEEVEEELAIKREAIVRRVESARK